MKLRLFFFVATGAVCAAVAVGQEGGNSSRPSTAGSSGAATSHPSATPSNVIRAERGRVILADEAVLASDRPGILEFVEPEEGAEVKKGQQVAGLKDEVAAAALRVAEETAKNDIEIRYAQAAAAVAEQEYRKSLQANKRTKDAIPEVEVERLRLSAERARLQIEKAEMDQEVARLQAEEKAAELATYQVTCPLDGVVTRVLKHDGEAVQQGDPILQIVRTDTVRVEGFVHVADALRMKVGSAVRVRLGGEAQSGQARLDVSRLPANVRGRVFEGKVGFIDVTANLTTHQVRVWAEVPNEGNLLLAGLPAEMEIVPAGDAATAAAGAAETRE